MIRGTKQGMEATMYEEGSYSNYSRDRVANLDQMKRKLTLDFNRSPKKQRTVGSNNFNPLLTSPDLKMLKLASPELEKFIIQQGSTLTTATSSSQHVPSTSSGFFFPKTVTVEQEEFVKGFEDTLEQFRYQDTSRAIAPTVVTVSNSHDAGAVVVNTLEYTQLETSRHNSTAAAVHNLQHEVPVTEESSVLPIEQIKEEPQTVPSVCGSPPVSPIDMESQEVIKLERKRLRNRIAASKCRRRKLERISKLEDKVSDLKNENTELQNIVNKLKDQVCGLKQEVMDHVTSGCQIPFVTHQ